MAKKPAIRLITVKDMQDQGKGPDCVYDESVALSRCPRHISRGITLLTGTIV